MDATQLTRPTSASDNSLRLFFATDLHGSTLCFKKLLAIATGPFAANVLILGGDIAAKELLFLVSDARGKTRVENYGSSLTFDTEDEVNEFAVRAENVGKLVHRCTENEYNHFRFSETLKDDLRKRKRIERLEQWLDLASTKLASTGTRLIINCGNDDHFYLDPILDKSSVVERPEGRILQLPADVELASCGYSLETPWKCPRDKGVTEDSLKERLEPMLQQLKNPRKAIFNFHCPPYGTNLDKTARLTDNYKPVIGPLGIEEFHAGSTTVLKAIEVYKPSLSLHGHIHGQHCSQRIGDTVCYNPGSQYEEGLLNGVFAVFDKTGLRQHTLINDSNRTVSPGFKAFLVSLLKGTVILAPFADWLAKQDQLLAHEELRNEIAALRQELKNKSGPNKDF